MTAPAPRLITGYDRLLGTMAVAHSVLVIAYHLVRDQQPSSDTGADSLDRLDTGRIERYPVTRLTHLGYEVSLTRPEAA